ncbi:EAL domain-containing protein [Rhodococcus sp. X156]|uniref:EAL domain-containing protein n=1 Tax=Rhodococcus sp. X156 TaxID=2499145 RepID=UPI000FD80792|nr:EAL domain-containing protein [Rhodococcus sp. X156]
MGPSSAAPSSAGTVPRALRLEAVAETAALDRLAGVLGAQDLLVLRRGTSQHGAGSAEPRFRLVGGVGAGERWAGGLWLDPRSDPLERHLAVGAVRVFHHSRPQRVFGPYFARAAVVVRLSDDLVVVFGTDDPHAALLERTDVELVEIAGAAAGQVREVPAAKPLADELEILTARRVLSDRSGPTSSVEDALAAVADVSREALGCARAVIWLPDGRLRVSGPPGLTLDTALLDDVMRRQWDHRHQLPTCVQDATENPLGYPLDPSAGICSYLTVAVGEPAAALLTVAHSDAAPRGFTNHERALTEQLALSADTGLATALLREQLLRAVVEESSAARELARVNAELAEAALRDALTGLANRSLLEQRTAHLTRSPAAPDRSADSAQAVHPVLLYIDLDSFKSVNDDYGHTVGDAVLVEFARRLRESCRPDDVPARLAGDEFALLMVEPLTTEQALSVAERVVRAAAQPFLVDTHLVTIGASVGVTTVPTAHQDPPPLDVLLHQADLAMYRAKSRGRGRAEVYTERIKPPVSSRNRRWADDPAAGRRLQDALDTDALTMQYQPSVDLVSGQVQGVTAGACWPQHPGQAMPSDQLVPLAERTGLIGPLGEWVLRQACGDIAARARLDDTEAAVLSVRVRPTQLEDPALPALVMATLEETGLPAERLCLLVSETGTSAHQETVADTLHTLQAQGVLIAVDGYGAGHSSVTLLRHLPLDCVHIGADLVSHVDTSPTDAVLTRLIIEAAHALGLRVCAEGVDRHAQLEQLAALGCDVAQGHLLGGPVSATLLDTRDRAVRHLITAGPTQRHGAGTLTTLLDDHGLITYVSADCVELLGYQPAELMGTRALDLVPQPHRDQLASGDLAAAERTRTHPLVRKDGSVAWVDVAFRPIREPGTGGLRRLSTTAVDVTDRVHAQTALVNRAELLRRAFDALPHGALALSPQGTVLQANTALASLLGRGAAELVGLRLHELVHPDTHDEVAAHLRQARTGGGTEISVGLVLLHADGNSVHGELSLYHVADQLGRPFLVGHLRPSAQEVSRAPLA